MDDGFPEGLRVLLVDDDTAFHDTLYQKLLKFNFQLYMCTVAETGLSFIQHAQDEFHIVIIARNMSSHMDAFKFVEQVRRLKKSLPIIMVLEGGEDNSMIGKGVQLGVDNYVIKPITGKMLRTSILVEHVFNMYRKRKTNQTIDDDAAWSVVQHEHSRKRKTLPNYQTSPRNDREESCGSSATPVKKPRLVWSNDLHHKFVEAVNQIGLHEARPRKIVELMKVEGLTRDNVSSHLQKYRLQIGQKEKLQKEP